MANNTHHDHYPFTDLFRAVKKPVRWIVKDLLPTGLCFVGGPAKSGKSTLTAAIACMVSELTCLALPPDLRKVIRTGPNLMLSYEADAGELRWMVEEGMKVKGKADASILVADDPTLFRLDEEYGQDALHFWLNDINPRILFLDPLRNFHGLDEKESTDIERLLRPWRTWAVENDSAVVIVHHTKKPGEQHTHYTPLDMRGSSAMFAMADSILMLTPVGPEPAPTRIQATFKRAAGWDRTIMLGTYGKSTGLEASDIAKSVYNLMRIGVQGTEQLATRLHIAKAAVITACAELSKQGKIAKVQGRWAVSKHKER